MAQQANDLIFSLQQITLLLWWAFSLWPRSFYMLRVWPKIKKKNTTKMKMILRDTMLQIKSEELMKLEKKQGGDGGGGGCDVDDIRKEE